MAPRSPFASALHLGLAWAAFAGTGFFENCLSSAFAQDAAPSPVVPAAPALVANPAAARMSSRDLADWIDLRFETSAEGQRTKFDVVDDPTFLRRVSLDLTGSIPSVSTTRDFMADPSEYKRDLLVDSTLGTAGQQNRQTDRCAEHLARVWRRLLVPGNGPGAAMATRLDPWLKVQLAQNVHYDELARSLVTAKPVTRPQPADGLIVRAMPEGPIVLYEAVGATPENLANSFARTFLGVRIGCAQCHDHPFAEWKQNDFWGVAAFFAGSKRGPNGEWLDESVTKIRNEANSTDYDARFLWGDVPQFPEDKTPRQVFAEWMTSPNNPNFASTAVNRVWQYLCGRGLTAAVDDLDTATPEERKILDELAEQFERHDFDLRWLMAGICQSRTYQRLCADGEDETAGVRPVKTLLPEQVYDSLEQALALPVSKVDGGPRHNGQMNELIGRLNEAIGNTPEDFRGGIPQTLLLMNGQITAKATDLDESRTLRAVVEAPFLSNDQKLEALYLAAFTRVPTEEEQAFLLKYVKEQGDRQKQKEAFAEIFWGLLNSPEFVLSR
ncbi:DUF1549 domain-containing protein [Planctomyces sp. SH-PL14]|uniref:DUF1549 domain-containing protein n=1 Tax=Planctomyces sp. SH-PL14 TaxID=1632864 RepID=UPI00078E95B7|nr:DUF1549 domain-containing protein [Planctomyces sp. SH-PL14]AMV20856.1 hypothetical protein VT03_23340 [Planctomyces sp. SH-PL14]